jgi:hypothetical protein
VSELLYDWRFTVNQVILAPGPLRPTTNVFFQLNTCGYNPYVTSSVTRGWVCRLQLLLALASAAILGCESRGTHDYILLSHIRVSPNLEGQAQEQEDPVIPPDTGFSFDWLLTRCIGRAISQAVSRWLPTAAARVRVQVMSCGICGGQSGTGAGLLRVLGFPCQFSFHRLLHTHHLSSGAGTIGQ